MKIIKTGGTWGNGTPSMTGKPIGDLKWLAYTRSFTHEIRTNPYERAEFLGTILGASIVLAAIWTLINW